MHIRKNYNWKAYDHCSARDKNPNLPIIILTRLVCTTAISQTASSENSTVMNYVISGTSLLVTGLTSISKYFNYSESKEAHRQAALNYLRLRSELAELLSTAHIENQNTKPISFAEFTKMYYNKFISVRENAPTLPGSIREAMDLTNKEKCKELKEKFDRNAENTKIDFSEIVEEEEIATLQINQAGGRTMNSTDI